jgi:prepilin-type N-terminal cleavage/methylation domain-containing protein
MKKKGFTLIELLAVLVILSIIIVISIPIVNKSVENRKENSFFLAAKSILRDVGYDKWSDPSFSFSNLNNLNLEKISSANYDLENSYVYFDAGVLKINLIGKGKFEGLYACEIAENSKGNLISRIPCEEFQQPEGIVFQTNGNSTYAKSGSTTVIVNIPELDPYSLKYLWTTSDTAPSEGSFGTSFTNGNIISSPAGVSGGYYLWVLAKDTSNNATITGSNVFNLDNERPVITMLGSSPLTITQGDVYEDAGATALDNIDGNLTSSISVVSDVNPSMVGTYTITYNVSDGSGNTAVQVTRIVNVTPMIDTIAPSVAFGTNGNATYARTRSTTVTVSDNVAVNTSSLKYLWNTSTSTPSEGTFSSTFTNGQTINSPAGVTGACYLWILAKDTSDNTTITRSNAFNLDNTIPVITMLGSSPITINQGDTYSDAGATASDNIDGNLTSSISVISTVNPSIVGTYTVTYNVSDSSGNTAIEVIRTVNVISTSEFAVSEGVNKPRLATGMTAIKWSGISWDTVSDPNTDTSWYDYANGEWANARTADGSMWVWIPRYAYQIATNYHTSNTGTINIKFLKDATNTASDNSTVDTIPSYTGTTQNNYIVHSAFNFGGTQLTGIWVAKFEASGSTSAVDIKPNVTSLRSLIIDNMFTAARNMETNSRYGWGTSGNGVDTHLIKNIEWGAVAYLFASPYGKNGTNIWVNPSNNYTTGCAGDSADSASTTGCLRSYETAQGIQASTTGTIYGIYDMRGGAHEYTAAYLNNGNANLGTYGSSLVNADGKYKDIYAVGGTDDSLTNYSQSSTIYGDGIWETSVSSGSIYSWFGGIWIDYPETSDPFFRRGGLYSHADNGGILGIECKTGGSSSGYSFRPVLLVDPDL